MKRFGALATVAFAVLGFAVVWAGGLNQDEGWYLYAANLVRDGQMPYRDFFYTQGPMLPLVYSIFAEAWEKFGLVGGRVVTLLIATVSFAFATALARLLAPGERRGAAGAIAFLLIGCNIYHVYYMAIPKTYALASLFLSMGFYLFAFALSGRLEGRRAVRCAVLFGSGLSLAFAAGARISLGAILAVAGIALAVSFSRFRWSFLAFGLGGAVGLAAVYGPFLLDVEARAGLAAAQAYHAARGGFDPVFTIGSLSRLVRWYLPVFVILGMGAGRVPKGSLPQQFSCNLLLWSFLAVFAVQMLAPFPYEDYQVPVMGLLAVYAAVRIVALPSANVSRLALLALGLAWGCSFGSPLLESWTTNGMDRFWPLKKDKTELCQLQDVAKMVEILDPGGKTLLTQDLYLAIETNRRVPKGLEMGPFSMLTEDAWRALLESAPCPVAALSGYTFAIEPPVCAERDMEVQMEFWQMLKSRYALVMREYAFGQNATTLLLLKRKEAGR